MLEDCRARDANSSLSLEGLVIVDFVDFIFCLVACHVAEPQVNDKARSLTSHTQRWSV